MPNNMGIVRYLLALAVIVAHFNLLAQGDLPFPFTSYSAVGGFFTLSGFLVYGSFLKQGKPVGYIKKRAIRLLPAYWTTIVFFAIVLVGASGLTPGQYFDSTQFWRYLIVNLSFMNFLAPDLPGVFQSQSISAVNVSLWTMKVEWMLYLSVPIVSWIIRKCKCRPTTVFLVIYAVSVCYRLIFMWMYDVYGKEIYNILGRQFIGQLMYFYVGVLIYYYYNFFIAHKKWILGISLTLLILSSLNGYFKVVVHPLAFGSLVIWVSMIGKWGTFEGKKDNVSYNMYLVHAPIIQLVAISGLVKTVGIYISFLISLTAIVILSLLINFFVEKPIQRKFAYRRIKS